MADNSYNSCTLSIKKKGKKKKTLKKRKMLEHQTTNKTYNTIYRVSSQWVNSEIYTYLS
jgi:hypothetical protein